jgi:Ca2+-binding RTX toxin-like protein
MNYVKTGTESADYIIGSGLNEVIYGLGGNDTILAGDGHDIIVGGAGADLIYGGAGIDAVDYTASGAGVMIAIGHLGLGGDAQGDFVASDIEYVTGSYYADLLVGSAGSNTLDGKAGNDLLYGLDGDDWLYGDSGDDTITGGQGADYISGGTGTDTASYLDSTAGVTIQIQGPSVGYAFVQAAGGTAQGDTVAATVENLEGSYFNDNLAGNDYANALVGGAGNDTISGRGGNDTIAGGQGADVLSGQTGIDTVSYAGSTAGVEINLQGGYGRGGDAEGDYLYSSFENVEGSAFRDIVFGNAAGNELFLGDGNDGAAGDGGADNIYGGNGNDYIMGNTGDDNLYGDAGDDTLRGDDAADRLTGGRGNDELDGGAGADTFVFTDQDLGDTDRIADFDSGQGDRINLSEIDADTGSAGNQAFTYVGMRGFSGTAGELHVVSNKLGMVLSGDTNGDRIADFSIKLDDAPTLTATDFML